MAATIAMTARTVQAGAQFIVVPPPTPVANGMAVQRTPFGLAEIAPAPFETVALLDGAGDPLDPDAVELDGWPGDGEGELSEPGPAPWTRTMGEIHKGLQVGVNFHLTRRDLKDTPADELEHAVMESFALGMGRAVARAILAGLGDLTLGAWSAAAAATAGVRHGDLRAIVGKAGTAATADGTRLLVAPGVPAEFSDQTANTYVGDFRGVGCAVRGDLEVLAKADRKGGLTLTAWWHLHPPIPASPKLWQAS